MKYNRRDLNNKRSSELIKLVRENKVNYRGVKNCLNSVERRLVIDKLLKIREPRVKAVVVKDYNSMTIKQLTDDMKLIGMKLIRRERKGDMVKRLQAVDETA